jgi:hypothetical protein
VVAPPSPLESSLGIVEKARGEGQVHLTRPEPGFEEVHSVNDEGARMTQHTVLFVTIPA